MWRIWKFKSEFYFEKLYLFQYLLIKNHCSENSTDSNDDSDTIILSDTYAELSSEEELCEELAHEDEEFCDATLSNSTLYRQMHEMRKLEGYMMFQDGWLDLIARNQLDILSPTTLKNPRFNPWVEYVYNEADPMHSNISE